MLLECQGWKKHAEGLKEDQGGDFEGEEEDAEDLEG